MNVLLNNRESPLAPEAATRRHLVFDAFRALILRAIACVDRRKHAYLLSRDITLDAFVAGGLLHQAHIFPSQFLGQMVEQCRHRRIGDKVWVANSASSLNS